MKTKIAFFDTKPYDQEIFEEINQQYNCEFSFFKFHITENNVMLAQGHDAVCVFVNDMITEPIIAKLHEMGIKLIALRCSGFNNVDFKFAYNKIHIVRVPAYSPHAIAEHTLALLMTLNRKIHRAYFRTRDSNFTLNGLMGVDLYQKTAGVIGTGRIGKILITILKGIGMNVLMYDVYPDRKFEQESGCKYVTLDEIFSTSDVISLNCPLTTDTEYIINRQSIAKMKTGVMILNTGRGKLINTIDLIEGIKSGKIGNAGLDVYEEEADYFFEDLSNQVLNDDVLARLLSFNNVIITSHQAFFTKEAITNIAETTMDNIDKFFSTNIAPNEICYQCYKGDIGKCDKTATNKCF